MRTASTDLLWLSRQCFKEFWGSSASKFDRGGVFLGTLKNLAAKTPDIDVTLDRHEVRRVKRIPAAATTSASPAHLGVP